MTPQAEATFINILLVTPNEGLSDQHMAEMTTSGILARRFGLNESGLMASGKDVVRVIEITKLVEPFHFSLRLFLQLFLLDKSL